MNLSFSRHQEQKRLDDKKRSMPWREYWHLYLSLIGTGILTAFAGVYLGLAPSASGTIEFQSTWDLARRAFFATYYAASFLLVAEGATLFAKDKLLNRDVEEIAGKIADVPAQRRSMTLMLWVSIIAIVLTTVAAGTMLASWLHALDQFVTIPAAAQGWVVLGPPALLVFDAVCAMVYQQNSKQSELDRWIEQQKRMAQASAEEVWAQTYVEQYNKVAPDAARSAALASAMNDARRWGGAGVDDLRRIHDVRDQGEDAPSVQRKAPDPEGDTARAFKPSGHGMPTMQEQRRIEPTIFPEGLEKAQPGDMAILDDHTPVARAIEVPEPEASPIMAEEPEVTASDAMTAPEQEVGTDQPSPT